MNNHICPLCEGKMELKNDILYCPQCNVYIGSQEEYKDRWQKTPFRLKSESASWRKKENNVMRTFKIVLGFILLLVLLIFGIWAYFYYGRPQFLDNIDITSPGEVLNKIRDLFRR